MLGNVCGYSKARVSVYCKMQWLLIGRPRLGFAMNQISPLLNNHECFPKLCYFANGFSSCFRCSMICLGEVVTASLRYHTRYRMSYVSAKEQNFCCSKICPNCNKILLYHLFHHWHFVVKNGCVIKKKTP